MDKIFKIVGLGEIVLDIYPDGRFVGGGPANVAQHIHQMGHAGIVASRVGRDPSGEYLIEELERRGMDTRSIQIDENHPTAAVTVSLNERGVPRFTCNCNAAFEYMKYDESFSRLANSVHSVVFSALAQRNSISYRTIQTFLSDATQAFKVFDLNLHQWRSEWTATIVEKSLQITDAVKFNESEFRLLKDAYRCERSADEDVMAWLADEFSLKIVAFTRADKGCLLYSNAHYVDVPAFKITPLDVTGAGDAFVAAMVVRYLEGHTLQEIAEAGNGLGAYVSMHRGAVPEYRGWPDMARFF